MKKILILALFFAAAFGAHAQGVPISKMPTFTGDPSGGYVPIIVNGVNRKIDARYFGYTQASYVQRKIGTDSLFWVSGDGVYHFISRMDTSSVLKTGRSYIDSSQAQMLAHDTAQIGDISIRTDSSISYVLHSLPSSSSGNWYKLRFPAAVPSVFGRTGAVGALAGDYNHTQITGVDSLFGLRSAYVADITTLENYTGNSNTVIVQDSLRGGTFNYVASATPDSVTVFKRYNGGYWQREYTSIIHASWFGLPTDSTTDALATLRQIFKVANGKKVIFPANRTYYVSDQIQIILSNSSIDFNNCTFWINDTWTHTWIFNLHNSSNVVFTGLDINGNRTVVSNTKQVMGLLVDSTINCFIDNSYMHDIDYHAVWVGWNTGLKFGYTKLKNIYGATSSADIYLSYDSTGNCSFNTIVSTRDTYQAGQVVYSDAGNTDIGTIIASNAGIVISYRIGRNHLGNILADHCGALLMAQNDGGTNITDIGKFPSGTVDNLSGYAMKGDASTGAAIYVSLCNNFKINSANVSFDTSSANRSYGVRVEEADNTSKVIGLSLNNIRVLYPSVADYWFSHNSYPIYTNNLTGISKNQGLRSDSALNYIYVPHATIDSAGAYAQFVASGSNMFISSDPIRRVGLNVQKLIDGNWVNQYTDSTYLTGTSSVNYLPYWSATRVLSSSPFYMSGNFMYSANGFSIQDSTVEANHAFKRYSDYLGMYFSNGGIKWAMADGSYGFQLNSDKTLQYINHPPPSSYIIPDWHLIDSAMKGKADTSTAQFYTAKGVKADTTLHPGHITFVLDSAYEDSATRAIARPYKVYTASLTQSGTSAPVATVLENTTGMTFTYGYSGVGWYTLTASGTAFPTGKSFVITQDQTFNPTVIFQYSTTSGTAISLHVIKTSDGTTGVDGGLIGQIEIRIYP